MMSFSELCQRLESVPFHRNKPAILAEYLRGCSERDASWALYLLLGGQLPRLLDPDALLGWIAAESGLPAWLLDECREQTGDVGEMVALLGELSQAPEQASLVLDLSQWIEEHLLPLAQLSRADLEQTVRNWWRHYPLSISWALHALALGRFPVHIPRRVAEDAVREAWGEPAVAELTSRISGLQPTGQRKGADPRQMSLF